MEFTLDTKSLQEVIGNAINDFSKNYDINELIQRARDASIDFIEGKIASIIQETLKCRDFLASLKIFGGKLAFRFKEYRKINIRLISGKPISIESPWFIKASPKSRRKNQKGNKSCHVGLLYFGFIGNCGTLLLSSAVQAALLCPSFEIAKRNLITNGIEMDVKTIRRLCMNVGEQALKNRSCIALTDDDVVQGRTLFVGIDGGRLRERKPKRGRRPKGQKRQGYRTDWREPTQIVIEWLKSDGSRCHKSKPLYDATMLNISGVFELLEEYLWQIGVSKDDRVVFCADGDRKYWKRFKVLAEKFNIKKHYEVIDYTHAKQNLMLVAEKLPEKPHSKNFSAIFKKWKNWLWEGNLEKIHSHIKETITSENKLNQALKKFKDYFLKNISRMQYAAIRNLKLPTGSGWVESAIRRVINLRLKSAGIFWKCETAEVMLFLRSTLLCDRWNIMLKNLFRLNRNQLVVCH